MSAVKPFLHTREKNIIFAVLLLQVLDNVAMVVIEETSPGSVGWLTWRDVLHIVDIMCCCAMLFPIFWSINHFRQGEGGREMFERDLREIRERVVVLLPFIVIVVELCCML